MSGIVGKADALAGVSGCLQIAKTGHRDAVGWEPFAATKVEAHPRIDSWHSSVLGTVSVCRLQSAPGRQFLAGPTVFRLSIFGTFRLADESGSEVPIKSRKARALLAYLALPPGKPRSREQIMALLWSDRGDQQARSSLRQALSGLRKDLGEKGLSALRVTDESLMLDPERVVVEPASPGEVFLDGLHLTDPAFEEWLRDERLRHDDTAGPEMRPLERAPPDKLSVAVLPFVNLSGEPEQDYFAQGITQDIITELARFRSLQVMGQLSVFELGDRAGDPRSVGQVLGVSHLVTGNIRKASNRSRVSVQLLDCETGTHEWAERYDRELADIFALQDDVVHSIVTILGGRITDAETERALRKRPERLEAYDYVLRGMYYRNLYDRESNEKGYRMAEEAVAAAPNYARALALLAWFHAARSWYDPDNVSHLDFAREFGLQAVKLDPTDGDCWSILAAVHLYRREFDLAERCARRARACNPNDLRAIAGCAEVFAYVGQREEALEALRQFEASEPFTPNWHWEVLGVIHFASGRYFNAAEAFGRMSHLNYWNQAQLAACYGHLGDVEMARKHLEAYAAEVPDASIRRFMQHEGKLFKNPEDWEPWLEGLRKAGLPE